MSQTSVVALVVNFVTVDRDTPDLFPASVQEYLSEDHLARFVLEIVDQLDLSHPVRAYAGSGSRPYHPATNRCPSSSTSSWSCSDASSV